MSIWDALTGRKSSSQQSSSSSSSSSSASATSPSSTLTTTDTFTPTPFDPSSAQGVDSFLNPSAFADPSQLHPLAGLNKESLEYLTLEDSTLSDSPGHSAIPSRGFSDDLCYGTGITYLTALSIGGAWGLQEGLRKSVGQPPKLRLNSTLNSITRRGPFLGNSAGVVAITYNCFNSGIGYLRGTHDAANTIIAGILSGEVMASQGSLAKEISETLIRTCLETWRSRAKPITPEEYIAQQWQLGGEKPGRPAGALVSDDNPRGYLFVPFDDSPPADQQLLGKRAELKRAIDERGFAASELLLDLEIMEQGYLIFEGLGDTGLAQMKTYEKVGLIAKYRLLETSRYPTPTSYGNPASNGPFAGERRMWMLRVTGFETLAIESFYLSLTIPFDVFLQRLEVAEPYKNTGISDRHTYEAVEHWESNRAAQRTEEEEAEWLESLIKEASLSPQEQASWSYQFCKEFDGVSRMVEEEWRTVDAPDEFDAMLRAMEGSKLAPVFMRTCKITEGRRISRLLNPETPENTGNTEMSRTRH
ncbi:hypothetical protein DL768_004052 [Monosporascus sp. mg162]|nr:hypothetical protein DL768_004052 [Monosporascus sp. mg162]